MMSMIDCADNALHLRQSVIAPGSDGDACPPETINGGGHGVNGDVAVPRPVGAADGGSGGELQSTETVITRLTYFFGGQAVAVRVVGDSEYPANNGLFYLHTDHLGSTSGLTYGLDESGQPHPAAGAVVPGSAGLFLPYGEYRQRPVTHPDVTDTGFTGHRHNEDIGLVFMNARFYVAGVGRFASADTLIPEPGAAIGYNRYAYANLNPVRFVDPTGHFTEDAIYDYIYEYECGASDTCAHEMYTAWEADAAWWAMLRAAQAGDTIFGGTSCPTDQCHYQYRAIFSGEGTDKLLGIHFLEEKGESWQPYPAESLSRLQSGTCRYGGCRWAGMWRHDGSGNVSDLWLRNGDFGHVSRREGSAQDLVVGSASTLACAPFGGPLAAGCFVIGTSLSSWLREEGRAIHEFASFRFMSSFSDSDEPISDLAFCGFHGVCRLNRPRWRITMQLFIEVAELQHWTRAD